jgi:four helix bundle protein
MGGSWLVIGKDPCMSSNFRDLVVWQVAMDLADSIYDATESFPKDELFGLRSQLRHAAVSIPSNIAEGQSRNTVGEFRHFLGNARGSLSEVETQLELAKRRKYIPPQNLEKLLAACDRVARLLAGLVQTLDQDLEHGRSLNRPRTTNHQSPNTNFKSAKAGK